MTEPLNTKARLTGKMILDWCKQKLSENEEFYFKESLCSGLQIIRFTSNSLDNVFLQNESETGYILCYEIYNLNDSISIAVTADKSRIGKRMMKTYNELLTAMNISDNDTDKIQFRKWSISDEITNISQVGDILDQIYDYEISYFETELKAWLSDHSRTIKSFPQFDLQSLSLSELPEEILIEGAMKDILTNKYERNIRARSRCIAYYGTACQICGFDFGEKYGEEFAGRIEVHHRKPLYEIKENYVVDPIKDLIPVCPNCHLVLHSKKDGVYTVEEVKSLISYKG